MHARIDAHIIHTRLLWHTASTAGSHSLKLGRPWQHYWLPESVRLPAPGCRLATTCSANAHLLGDLSSLTLARCAPCPRRLLLRPYITYIHIPRMPVSPGITHASKRPTQARPTAARPACDQLQTGDQPPLLWHAAEVAVASGGRPSRSQSEPLELRLCDQSVPQLASRYLLALAASTSSTSTTNCQHPASQHSNRAQTWQSSCPRRQMPRLIDCLPPSGPEPHSILHSF